MCSQLTKLQLIPQIIKNYRRHSTEGLHPTMYLTWALGGIPLGVYNLVKGFNVALLVQPHILILLSLIAWAQCYYYDTIWGWVRAAMAATLLGLLIGGIEVGLYFGLRLAHSRGSDWPLVLMAVLAAVLLSLGVLRHYVEIFKARSVQGISFLFVSLDAAGDLVSILSLLFEAHIDIVGIVIYSVELVLWIGIGMLGFYFRFVPWLTHKVS